MAMEKITRADAQAKGLKRFFTGEPCMRGHIAERQTTNGRCFECSKQTSRNYRARNPDKTRALTKNYKKSHPEWVKERAKARYDRNPEHIQLLNKKWLDKNPDFRAAYMREWRAENPELARASRHRRRARIADSLENYTASDVKNIKKAQRGKCAICHVKLGSDYHVDHIVPLKLGGDNGRRNIQLLCPKCNVHKSFRDPLDYMRSQGRLL